MKHHEMAMTSPAGGRGISRALQTFPNNYIRPNALTLVSVTFGRCWISYSQESSVQQFVAMVLPVSVLILVS